MGLKKFKDIIKSIGAPDKDDTLLGVFNGKTAQKSIEDILNYTALQNQPITILGEDFKVSDLKESSLYFTNKEVEVLAEDGSVMQTLFAGTLIITGDSGEVQLLYGSDTYYVPNINEGGWLNSDYNHITTEEVNELLSDLSRSKITYYSSILPNRTKTTNTIADFAKDTIRKTMALDSTDLKKTIKTAGKYNIYSDGDFLLGYPGLSNFTPLTIKVNKGDTIYVNFSKTDTECLCDIVYIGDISKNIPDDVDYSYSTVDVWSGQLGFEIGATEYDTSLWQVVSGCQGDISRLASWAINLPREEYALIYSTGNKVKGAYPEYRKAKLDNGGLRLVNDILKINVGDGLILRNDGQLAVRIGDGLKFKNGVLSAVATSDIASDQLKQIIGGLE